MSDQTLFAPLLAAIGGLGFVAVVLAEGKPTLATKPPIQTANWREANSSPLRSASQFSREGETSLLHDLQSACLTVPERAGHTRCQGQRAAALEQGKSNRILKKLEVRTPIAFSYLGNERPTVRPQEGALVTLDKSHGHTALQDEAHGEGVG